MTRELNQPTHEEVAEQMNAILEQCIEVAGISPFLREPPRFRAFVREDETQKNTILDHPFTMKLTPIGYWTSVVDIRLGGYDMSNEPTHDAEISWSTGGTVSAEVQHDLLGRALAFKAAWKLAFLQWKDKNEYPKNIYERKEVN